MDNHLIKIFVMHFLLVLRDAISAQIINSVEINENNEPFVDIRLDDSIFLIVSLNKKRNLCS